MDNEITGHSSSVKSHRAEETFPVTAGEQMWELQASWPPFGSCESHTVNPLGMHFYGHTEEVVATGNSQHDFHKVKSIPDQHDCFL